MWKEKSRREGGWQFRKGKGVAFGAQEWFCRDEGVQCTSQCEQRPAGRQKVEGLGARNESSQVVASLFSKK